MANEINTLEEARAEILRLQEANTQLTNERDTLSQNNDSLSQELESVRKLNQQYFNKLSQQYIPAEDKTDADEEKVPSCEDFARTLNIF
jgi:FtsZ-binding cell division protein ZapB